MCKLQTLQNQGNGIKYNKALMAKQTSKVAKILVFIFLFVFAAIMV